MPGGVLPDGNGGRPPTFSDIQLFPSTVDFGNIPTGTPTTLDVTVTYHTNTSSPCSLTLVTISGAGFSLSGLPSFPHSLPSNGSQVTFQVVCTAPGAGPLTGIVQAHSNFNSPSSSLKANGITTNITVVPAALNFVPTVINTVNGPLNVVITNHTGVSIQLTGAAFSNPDYAFSGGAPTFPITLANGANTTLSFQVTPSVSGPDNGTVTITTNIAGPFSIVIPAAVIGILFVEDNALQNTTRNFLLGFEGSPSQTYLVDPTNFNSELASNLQFNNPIWNSLGYEKVLRRVWVLYENIGVCTITFTASSIRYDPLGNKIVDFVQSTITIGDVTMGSGEYSAAADLQISGEMIFLQVSRAANAGALNMIGFYPELEDKGEKVNRV